MNKILFKDFLIEIKKTKIRFLAIFSIVCLGVAIYSGIGAVADDMRYSIDKYYDDYNLFDFHMMGSLGIEEKDVDAFRELNIVKDVFATYSKEILIKINGKSSAFRIEAYDFKSDVLNNKKQVNRFKLVEGKLPENKNECLLEKGKINTFSDLNVGSYLKFSLNKDDKIEDFFNIDGCKVSGLVESPYYLSYQKGPSKLGDGSLYSYIYIDKSAFNIKFYTDLYLTLKDAEKLNTYKNEYEKFVSLNSNILQKLGEKRANIRYENIYKEFNDKYNDGLKKYNEGKKEYEKKIIDAENKINDAKKEYENSNQKYLDGYKKFIETIKQKELEIENGEKKINENETILNKKYDETYIKIRKLLLDTKNEIELLKNDNSDLINKSEDLLNNILLNKQIFNNSLSEILFLNKKIVSKKFVDSDKENLFNNIESFKASSEKLLNLQNEENKRIISDGEKNKKELSLKEELYYNFEKQIDLLRYFKDSNLLNFRDEINEYLKNNDNKYSSSLKKYEEEKNIVDNYRDSFIVINGEKKKLKDHLIDLELYKKNLQDKIFSLISFDKKVLENDSFDENSLKLVIDEIFVLKDKIQNIESDNNIKNYINSNQNIKISEIRTNIYEKMSKENGVIILSHKISFIEGRKKINESRKLLINEKVKQEKEFDDAKKKLFDAKQEIDKNIYKFEIEKKEGQRKLDKASDELVKAKNKIENLNETKWYSLGRDKHYSFVDFKQTANRMEAISKIFPIFFFLVSALVCSTTMTRLIDEQRLQIGTLKALGYSKLSISLKYIFYAFFASFFGSLLGLIVGMSVLPLIIYNTWKMMYVMPNMSYDTQILLILSSILFSVSITVFVTFISVNNSLREKPSILMRPKISKIGKKIIFEKFDFIWYKLSFFSKVTLRNILRYKKRFFMTIFGIMGTTALLVAGFGIKDSISSIVNRQFYRVFRYDGIVNFKNDISFQNFRDTFNEIKKYNDIDGVLSLYTFNGTIKNEYGKNSVHVGVYDDYGKLSNFVSLHDRISNKKLNDINDGIFISEKIAINLKLDVGSEVTLVDNNDIERKVLVKGIFENYLNHYIYLKKNYFENNFGLKVNHNSLYISIKDNDEIKQSKFIDNFSDYKEIDSINFHLWLQNNFEKMVEGLNVIVFVLVICAAMLSFVVLINLTNVNISERLREIATLKVLGFDKKEVIRYIYRENLILTFIGGFFGLILGKFLHQFIMKSVELENIMFGRDIKFSSYLISFILTFIFTYLVNLLMKKKVEKIEMVESLKSVE